MNGKHVEETELKLLKKERKVSSEDSFLVLLRQHVSQSWRAERQHSHCHQQSPADSEYYLSLSMSLFLKLYSHTQTVLVLSTSIEMRFCAQNLHKVCWTENSVFLWSDVGVHGQVDLTRTVTSQARRSFCHMSESDRG